MISITLANPFCLFVLRSSSLLQTYLGEIIMTPSNQRFVHFTVTIADTMLVFYTPNYLRA